MTSSSKKQERVIVRNDGKVRGKMIHEEFSFFQLQSWVLSYVLSQLFFPAIL